MAVADVIGKQVFNMIKNSGRVQESVLNMKDKIVKESLNTLKKSGIDPAALPFDPIAVLNGDVDPNSITIPDVVCSVPPIPPDKIEPAIGAIDQYKSNLGAIIENSNKLKSALIDLQTPLQSISSQAQTMEGIVKWFNDAKGFGFLTPDEGEKDLFVHMSEIQMEGFKTLKEGQKVEFEQGETDKGPCAKTVVPK